MTEEEVAILSATTVPDLPVDVLRPGFPEEEEFTFLNELLRFPLPCKLVWVRTILLELLPDSMLL